MSDSIVAEDIGQFPDKNVGEALSRVTGIELSRDFGEGSQVQPHAGRIGFQLEGTAYELRHVTLIPLN